MFVEVRAWAKADSERWPVLKLVEQNRDGCSLFTKNGVSVDESAYQDSQNFLLENYENTLYGAPYVRQLEVDM